MTIDLLTISKFSFPYLCRMNYIEALQKRYSVKKFNKAKIPADILKDILEAGRLSASSLGLQPYKIYVVESDDMLTKLQDAFYNKSQVSTCSHLIIISSKKEIEDHYIDGYFKHITEVRKVEIESLDKFRKSINSFRDSIEKEKLLNWNEKQSYIVLGNLMFASALERVDSCPMEGFKPGAIEEILGIDTDKESVTVTLALGYRAEDDSFQHMKKVRKNDDKLFKFL